MDLDHALPPFVASATIRHDQGLRPSSAALDKVARTLGAGDSGSVLSAFGALKLNVGVMKTDAIAYAHDLGHAYLLQDSQDKLELYCCPALPRVSPNALVRSCADHCAAIATALGPGWTWSVRLTHVGGDEFPFTVSPRGNWLTEGGIQSPAAQACIAVLTVMVALPLQSALGRDDLVPGTILALVVSLLTAGLTRLFDSSKSRRYLMKTDWEQ